MSWYRVMCCGNLAECIKTQSRSELVNDLNSCLGPECAEAWPIGHTLATVCNADVSVDNVREIREHYKELAREWFNINQPNHIRALSADLRGMIGDCITVYSPHVLSHGEYICDWFDEFLPPGAPYIFEIRNGKVRSMHFRESGGYVAIISAGGLLTRFPSSSIYNGCFQCIGIAFCPEHKYLEVGAAWVRRVARLYGLSIE